MATNTPLYTGGLPRGELLGRYRSYDDAQKVVDHLAAAEDFDVKNLSIVGNDLRSVEHIRSRLSYPRVAGAGAAQGAMFGLFIGLLIMLFSGEAPLLNLLLAVILGMAIWMIIGVVSYAARRGKRDFASSSQLVGTTFDIVCEFAVAGRARQLVQSSGVMGVNRWNDPTGAGAGGAGPAELAGPGGGSGSAGSAGEQPTSHPDPEAGHPSEPGSDHPGQVGAGEPSPAAVAGSGATDGEGDEGQLPNGRPRYGARLSDYQKSPESPADPGQSGPGEEESADNEPPQSGTGRPPQESEQQRRPPR